MQVARFSPPDNKVIVWAKKTSWLNFADNIISRKKIKHMDLPEMFNLSFVIMCHKSFRQVLYNKCTTNVQFL